MKLFSRKGLAAAATTVALTATALTAPAMAQGETETPVETTTTPAAPTDTDEPGEDTTTPQVDETVDRETVTQTIEPGSSLSSEDTDPGDIKDWIGVFTTVIGALSALFVFMDRHVIEN